MKEVADMIKQKKNNLPDSNKQEKQSSPMTPIQILLLNFLIVITILWILFGSVVGLVNAPNNDMYPNIKSKDLILYYRLNNNYHAQDIVVLTKNNTTYIGRIVAAGGDTVDISDSERLVINGNTVAESGIYASTPRFEGFVNYPVKLGKNEYFILADARNGAEDSRYYGKVSADEICGEVVAVIRRNSI